MIYRFIMTSAGYLIIKDCPFLPPMLGGSGDLDNWFKDLPAWEKPPYYDTFFIISIGFFLEDLVELSVRKKKKDFAEMFLHHLVSAALIFFSYIINCSNIGLLIVWLHYVADVFVGGARSCMELKSKLLPGIFVTLTLISWAYTRLFVFAFVIKTCTKVNFKEA
jgi:acyl-CoA-dependent ceramide synthase